ncbi:MAG: hypothetical protein IKP48_08295 [Bacteroidaceae bacterium]|jgi:hypothetical protein|nr:hypothetical protein [Bacteroidaceae bacterium]
MSLLKKLQIGDNVSGRYTQEYLLTDYSCHTLRQFDEFRPKSEKYCDYIEMSVVAPGNQDMHFYKWFINQTSFSGRILVQLPPKPNMLESETHEIQFEVARCFSFEEDYHIDNNQLRILKLKFIAREVKINDITFYRN